jgi:SnoaL-like polyketide cyclase
MNQITFGRRPLGAIRCVQLSWAMLRQALRPFASAAVILMIERLGLIEWNLRMVRSCVFEHGRSFGGPPDYRITDDVQQRSPPREMLQPIRKSGGPHIFAKVTTSIRVAAGGASREMYGGDPMQDNKNIVARWFKEFWGNPWNPRIVNELATSDIFVHYPMHEPKKGRAAVQKFMTEFRDAFPDLNFSGVGNLIADGDFVVGRWEGGGTGANQERR